MNCGRLVEQERLDLCPGGVALRGPRGSVEV